MPAPLNEWQADFNRRGSWPQWTPSAEAVRAIALLLAVDVAPIRRLPAGDVWCL